MPEQRTIPCELILPPEAPMRESSLLDGLPELCESIAAHGLQQPIGVRELDEAELADPEAPQRLQEHGYNPPYMAYRLIWGHRRLVAHNELGLYEIRAVVYSQGEAADDEMLKAHENFHRTELNEVEEGRYYLSLIERNGLSMAEVSRRCRRDPSRVSRLVNIVRSDPEIVEALRVGAINQAQANEIVKARTKSEREYLLYHAAHSQTPAHMLKITRETAEASDSDHTIESALQYANTVSPVNIRNQSFCVLHNDWVEMSECPPRAICHGCWDLLKEFSLHCSQCTEYGGQVQAAQEEG